MKTAHILQSSAALGAIMLTMPAMAQQAPAGTAPAAEEQGLQDHRHRAAPRGESAKGGDRGERGDRRRLDQPEHHQATDLTRVVPSLQVAPAASFTQIYLRGIGTFGANAFAEQGVAFNLDGVYLSRPACSTISSGSKCSRVHRARSTATMRRAAR